MNSWNERGDRVDCFVPLFSSKYPLFWYALLIWPLKYTN